MLSPSGLRKPKSVSGNKQMLLDFMRGPDFRIEAKTTARERVVVKDAFSTPYPKLPVKDKEVGKTPIDRHGGYWDYFSVLKQREQQWLELHKEAILSNKDLQECLIKAQAYQYLKLKQR